eukprot:TRINITY_DN42877_c0_g1_i1.p1 TRINITY_DN42877_c0_g1~~TRINITY_DN42877_c0_g1_i1.p1  ORF type:complete len:118 (+),score=7.75 TRINITY_DN42877_c0_g1_i1:138-491(+)
MCIRDRRFGGGARWGEADIIIGATLGLTVDATVECVSLSTVPVGDAGATLCRVGGGVVRSAMGVMVPCGGDMAVVVFSGTGFDGGVFSAVFYKHQMLPTERIGVEEGVLGSLIKKRR